jgi:hypothetical protein
MTKQPLCPLQLERYAKKIPLNATTGLWQVHTDSQPYPRLMTDAVLAVSCAGTTSRRDALAVLDALLNRRYAVGQGHWGSFVISEVSA